MSFAQETLLVLSNLPDRAAAESLAHALIERRVAACVSILGACRSVYRWQGKVEAAEEVPLLIKTTRAAWPALEALVRELHPYEVPELIAVPLAAGLPAYLDWIAAECVPDTTTSC